jgi:hypothetical protein
MQTYTRGLSACICGMKPGLVSASPQQILGAAAITTLYQGQMVY